MHHINNNTQNKSIKKEFKTKDAIMVFSSFTLMCTAIIFVLVSSDLFTLQKFLSFNNFSLMLMEVAAASSGLVMFGIVLAVFIPSTYIDDANKNYQNGSLPSIVVFMFLAALFEELLFRGIIQNALSIFTEHQWATIVITTALFLALHTQYFKKPIMLLNISVPSLVFGWIYVETSNILAPFFVHFIMNVVMTFLFKYRLLSIRN
ncbi:lysostaphin resistance A-like protein [Priestia megaterium]|uniref:CPBP family intramembrane glutamic endopeptidase n=1 Tax=Priestia megaterium TaxID=1404 RepID=UPI0035DE2C35